MIVPLFRFVFAQPPANVIVSCVVPLAPRVKVKLPVTVVPVTWFEAIVMPVPQPLAHSVIVLPLTLAIL